MTRRAGWLVAALAVAAVSVLFLWVSRGNPPGFYKDEAAIGWNAHTIAETGKDEYGNTWPLFFRSFDDWKSPVYVYLLAAEFRVAPDGILAARLLSAVLGAAAVILLGLLAGRIARNAAVAVAVMLSAALNPWLFEVSRLVFEVAAFPLLLVLFLLALRRAYDGGIWRWSDAALVALPLGLLVYAYPTGRLFAPALAVGLALFGGYGRWPGVFRAWAVFAVTLLPIVVFSARNPGALSARLNPWTTYLHSGASPGFVVETFV
jgi:4-amino-4-deoxy-L-arabinose transferase-like glycosyltransferase